MKLCIRAHDLGVMGTEGILSRLDALGLDGVQLVCYKAYEDIPQQPGAITPLKAKAIGDALRQGGKDVCLVGAYFNPVHPDEEKRQRGIRIFEDYLRCCGELGCGFVGSETGSMNGDDWTYNPLSRTEACYRKVADTFAHLCDVAKAAGSAVAMEGAWGHVCHDVKTLAKVREMMERDTKVIFDLYNYLDPEKQYSYMKVLEEGLETFAGDILLFHMKDWCFRPGSAPKQVPLGTGQADMKQILGAIKAYDKDAVLTLEETTGDDIPLAVATVRELWESV